MSQRIFKLLILITAALALLLFVWLVMPQPQAAAQCGARASSCKTCHKVQGKLRSTVFVELTLFLFYLLERKIGQRADKLASDKSQDAHD
jgi:hypothetical protein